MSTNVGEIDLSLILNSDKFNSQLKNVDSQADKASTKISSTLSKIGKAVAVAFSVTAIVKFGKECLNVATETSNAWIGLNSILTGQGKSFSQAKKFINDYIADGLVPLNNAVGAYKNLALRGYSSDQIQKTMNALKNSATFARQSTYSLGDAVQTATEGLKNENSVVVDNAGVTKNVAKMWEDYAKKIGKTTNNLTQAEKIQAEVNGILEETKFQSNDAALYANTYSGKIAQLNSAFTNMKTAIGNAIQPLAKLFVPIITTAVNAVTKLFTALSGLLSLFGLKADSVETVSNGIGDLSSNAGQASDAIDGVGDSAKKAGDKAKKASNNLAAFDNLNVLPKDTDSSSGSDSSSGGSSGLTDSLDVSSTIKEDTSAFDGLMGRVKELASIFKEGFDISFGDTNFDGIIQHLTNIKDTIIDIWTDPKVVGAANNWVQTLLFTLGQATGAVVRIGVNLTEGFVGSIDKYLSQNVERIKSFIINMFNISSKDLKLTGNMWQALGEISDVFKGDTAKQIGADIIAMFANPFMSVVQLCSKFALDVKGILFQPIIDNAEKIKTTLENVMKPIQTFTGTLAQAMTYVGDKWNEVYDQHIHPLMESIKTGLSDTFGKFLEVYNTYVVPFLQNLANNFNDLWNTHLKPFVDNVAGLIGSIADAIKVLWENWIKPLVDWIIQNIIPVLVPIFESIWNTISSVFGAIADTIGGIIQTFKGLIDFIVGIFTGDWNKAWEGIKTFFTGIWNAIKGVVSIVWNAIKGIIETAVNVIKGIITTVFNAIKSIISNIFNAVKNTVTNIWNGIKNNIINSVNNIKNGIINAFQTAYNKITSIFRNIGSFFSGVWNGIKNTFSALGTKIGDAISGAVKAGINGLLGMIERTVNGFINMINGAIGVINAIPGVNISKLNTLNVPRLAEGGYVKANTPQLAMIGDNKHQGEVVAPEDKMLDMILTALKMFKDQDSSNQNKDGGKEIVLNFNGTLAQLIRVLKPELDRENIRKGDKLILGGAN
nr:MAG TPA_asm: minor tail protein [Caudoviricetes sp.]